MTKAEIERMLDKTGVPYRYHHFEEKDTVDPPFLVWNLPNSANTRADGMVYCKSSRLNIELYTNERDLDLEQRVEDILDLYGIAYEKTGAFLDSELMYEALYEMEV